MGAKLWNSLTPEFQIEIMGSREEYEKSDETDGPLLWDFVRRRINPTTTIGASRLKDAIETKTLADFDHDVVKFNTWFCDTRDLNIRDEGGGYDEYLRSLFRAYQVSDQQEFKDTIAEEKRNWVHGKVKPGYSFRDLMEVARVTFNNLVEDESWTVRRKKVEKSEQKNYLALATQLLEKFSKSNLEPSEGGKEKFPNYAPWRFDNPEGLTEKVIRNNTMRWCKNDCHPKPMWCGRKVYLNKADYLASQKKQSKNKPSDDGGKQVKVSKEFKLALASLTSEEDFSALEQQFFPSKE